jgi:hypothetical protein
MGTDLFGCVVLSVTFGRTATDGRAITRTMTDEVAATRTVGQILARRAAADRGVGVG